MNEKDFFELLDFFQEARREGLDVSQLEEKLMEYILREFLPAVEGTIGKYGKFQRADRDAICSDIWMALYQSLSKLRTRKREGLYSYVFQVTRSKVFRWLRRKLSFLIHLKDWEHIPSSSEDQMDTLEGMAIQIRQKEWNLFQSEVDAYLRAKKLSTPSENEWRATKLHYIDKLPYREIAELLKTTPENARQLAYRCIKKMQKIADKLSEILEEDEK